jgi:hypothetical protein
MADGDELPLEAVAATGDMLSILPKPGRNWAAAEATGTEGAGAADEDDPGDVTTLVEGAGAGGTTTIGAGSLCEHAPSNANATTDTGRIRNLLIASLLGWIFTQYE